MPSNAKIVLDSRIKEIDEIIAARDSICSGKPGKPAQKRGAALMSAGTTLLSAIFEGYIEKLYEQSLDVLYASRQAEVRELKKFTSEKNNNANNHQVNNLFFYAGIPWIMTSPSIHWKKCKNADVQKHLGNLSSARNKIAHGVAHHVKKNDLVYWRKFIEMLSNKLDDVVRDHVNSVTGTNPW